MSDTSKPSKPIVLVFLALVVCLAKVGIAFAALSLLAYFPSFLAKLEITRRHWFIELQEAC